MVCCQARHLVVRSLSFPSAAGCQIELVADICSNTGNLVAKEDRAREKGGEGAVGVQIGEEKEKVKKFAIEKIQNLPPPPVHTPFQGLYSPHRTWSIGPAMGLIDPYALFSLFFSEGELDILAKNTNLYAAVHDAGVRSNSHPFVRKWHPTTPRELLVFLAILILWDCGRERVKRHSDAGEGPESKV